MKVDHVRVNVVGEFNTHELLTQERLEAPIENLPAELFAAIHKEMKENKEYKILVFFPTVRATNFFTQVANKGA